MGNTWVTALAPSVAVFVSYLLSQRDRRKVAAVQAATTGAAVAVVTEKIAAVHTLVNGQHDVLQKLADDRGAKVSEQAVTIAHLEEKANGGER
jgi:ABC-type Co2+ transport system permease subunit